MTTDHTIVIVGAGLAGATAARTVRDEGFTGRVVLVGTEPEPPYERPPLSKDYLLGKTDKPALFVHEQGWYQHNSVELLLGRSVTRLDRAAREVELDDGARLGYTTLLLATGATPRTLPIPGADLDGVVSLRRVEDADRLATALRSGRRIVVVGAGWIGLEVAAAARHHGCEVTVVEPQPAPLATALGSEMGGFFADLHRDHGVDLRLGRSVIELRATGVRSIAVRTDDGAEALADTVVVAVGVRPNTELAEQSGLTVDNGVLVDATLRTDDPHIYAAGDVANAVHPRYARPIRVEHWANALHSGPAAAKAMLGHPVSYDRIPYFFTDQYDVGMEFTGWFPPGGYDTVVVRGDTADHAFHAFWLRSHRVIAGMHVNRWDQGIHPAQQLITTGAVIDPAQLADPTVPLTEFTTNSL